ncbi:uncharacterized protein Z519_00545 [Cladophialophora bantiana CBS 173.52]|uniref:Uncharacterized protein n=1 Tax=Cladophialophora bantiana (strain ATCC 10958 / CBS 173.52 / CDC B-1940 / NIH 8579) TaxID=1442370 RepID=A0A0D2GKE7_CLAB1|nr:uncharacterized protein Z519_00545 [Cladophialophora bantiana CBS 173.52]KIW98882.1 hypothetical protein Z519_00545 [Cladophialophora bantiana CBS 173.52]
MKVEGGYFDIFDEKSVGKFVLTVAEARRSIADKKAKVVEKASVIKEQEVIIAQPSPNPPKRARDQ